MIVWKAEGPYRLDGNADPIPVDASALFDVLRKAQEEQINREMWIRDRALTCWMMEQAAHLTGSIGFSIQTWRITKEEPFHVVITASTSVPMAGSKQITYLLPFSYLAMPLSQMQETHQLRVNQRVAEREERNRQLAESNKQARIQDLKRNLAEKQTSIEKIKQILMELGEIVENE